MLTADRPAFVKLAEALFAAFDKPPSDARIEAYWRGLQAMHLLAFEAVVNHVVGPDGEEELPIPRQLYSINRRLVAARRAAELEGRKAALKPGEPPPPEPDRFECYANRVLVAVLCSLTAQHGNIATDASLAEMIHVKHNYADKYREMCVDEPDACVEMRDALIAALTRRFVPREAPPQSNDRPAVKAAAVSHWQHPSAAIVQAQL